MDSVLSGFSNNYEGTQIGQGYAGNVGSTGSAASGSSQGVDISQLQPGDTFQGEIVSVNGEDVQIQLANGQYMAAKLERDVQLALGQVMNLQVQSNKDNRVVLKPVYDSNTQMMRVGESALRAAHMAVNDRTLTLVSTLIENGMSINKSTLMLFNRLTLQNPNASLADLIKLNKLQLPVNDTSITQLQNYQNMEHKLLDGIKEASDEILKLYDTLTANQDVSANGMSDAAQGAVSGQTALENGGKFMEQVLVLLAGEEEVSGEMQDNPAEAAQEGQNVQNGQSDAERTVLNNILDDNAEGAVVTKSTLQEQVAAENVNNKATGDKDARQLAQQEETVNQNIQKNVQQDSKQFDTILNQLKGERPQALSNKIVSMIRDGKMDIKDVKQLLMDSDIGRQLTTEQKSAIFHSEPFKSMLKNGLQKQWTLTPQDLTQEGKVEEFYQKLAKESGQLTRMMNEAMQESGQHGNGAQARAMGNINENVEFMNQMN
ncbi:MAG: hypothetical protein K2M91_16700, partial [Lachnospiraceae bacterium]|nr:hypothetical protein [Lachnospiraceae bacterium]